MGNKNDNELSVLNHDINNLIYIIRGQQVILDSDLAGLYGYEVKNLNKQVKRNMEKFPKDFMFQLTKNENDSILKFQFGTSSHGGRRSLPYAFTEQGVYMLATVLKGEIATTQSIMIIREFKKMRHLIIENHQLLNHNDILKISNRLAKHEEDIQDIKQNMASKTDIHKIMNNFINEDKIKEIVILDGQKFEAFEAYANIYKKAKHSIYIIDDYVDINTLSILKKKKQGIETIIFTDNKGNKRTKLQQREVEIFNEEFPSLLLKKNNAKCHDRFIILDYNYDIEKIYHCGASSKDAGNKVCCINHLSINEIIDKLIKHLLLNEDYQF